MSFAKYKDLLKSLGFQSFLWTQFFGAFNDNAFKIVISMIAMNVGDESNRATYVSLVGAVFILPFFLFSGYAGHLADRYNKRSVLIVTKSFEIVAMVSGVFAMWSGSIWYMLCTLFLLATHSTFFSPAKYGVLPEMLPQRELSRANGLLEMSTFVAIIMGTAIGTFLYSIWKNDLTTIGYILIAVAVGGTLMSFGIGRVPDPQSKSRFSGYPWTEVVYGLKRLKENKIMLVTVAAITYFWFLGALLQMDILILGKEVLHLSDAWIGILIVFIAIGIGIGSIVAGRLSGDKIEPGLVPIGAAGMGLFSIMLAYSNDSYRLTALSLSVLGFFGGIFIVPLNAYLQQKSDSAEKGRLIATTNFIGTASILLASGALWFLNDVLDISADKIVLIFGFVTMGGTLFVIKALPDFLIRFSLWFLTHTVYKIKIVGGDNVPYKGPALLVSNHISFADGLLVGACAHRFIRFLVYKHFFDMKPLNVILKHLKAIPISDGGKRDTVAALQKAREEIQSGHVVCIFAEGMISRTGNMLPFKKGFTRIVDGLDDVPVVPVYLDRVWGSAFSFKGGAFFWKWPQSLRREITVTFGKPMKNTATPQQIRQAVLELGAEAASHRRTPDDTLQLRLTKLAKKSPSSVCIRDAGGKTFSRGEVLIKSLILARWIRNEYTDGKIVALMLPGNAASIIMNAAALFAGKTVVNIDPDCPAETKAAILKDCGATRVITSRQLKDAPAVQTIHIEDIFKAPGVTAMQKAATELLFRVLPYGILSRVIDCGLHAPDALAAIIYDSGPVAALGAKLSHDNILSNIEGVEQITGIRSDDALFAAAPTSSALGYTISMWLPLISGITVIAPTSTETRSACTAIRSSGATILTGDDAFIRQFLTQCEPQASSKLRLALTCSAESDEALAREFRNKFGVDLLIGFGGAELSAFCSLNIPDVVHGEIKQTGYMAGTMGHTIPGMVAKIICPSTGAQLEYGTEGLLFVKGPNIMKGYLNNDEKTDEIIVNGWFNTGRRAVINDDGFIRLKSTTKK